MHSLSRHQAHELNAMVRWLCVCAFIIVTQPGLLRFRTACDASRAFQKHLAAAVFSFEGWASWGTPKGRGAHAAYSRRAARRQTWLLVLLCAPTWIMNVASCHDPITLPGAREQGERLGKLAVWIVIAIRVSPRHRLRAGTTPLRHHDRQLRVRVHREESDGTLVRVVSVRGDPANRRGRTHRAFLRERDRAYYGGLAARGVALGVPGLDDFPSRATRER